jgi:hypothetical protein
MKNTQTYRNAYKVLVRKRKGQLQKPTHRWEILLKLALRKQGGRM